MSASPYHQLRMALTDEIMDHLKDPLEKASVQLEDGTRVPGEDPGWTWYEENIERPVLDLLCLLEGHEVEDDHCGIPEHRYCLLCNKRMGDVPTGKHTGLLQP